jgi:FkbM family methyltransferase
VRSNNLENVEIMPFALGKTNCTRDFYAPSGNNIGTGSLLGDYNPSNNTIATSVPQRMGDEVLRELALNKPAVLKIDVEGSEKEVLEGIPQFIRSVEPIIIMEISSATRRSFRDGNELHSLFGPGYDLFVVTSYRDRYRLTEFELDRANGNILALPQAHTSAFEHIIFRL